MSITHETWQRCKVEYITGKGSLREIARRNGTAPSSVEKKARKEDWTKLRADYEAAQLSKLFPPVPVIPPLAPVSDGVVSETWLAQRQGIHYRDCSALLDKARALIDKKLSSQKELETDELARLTSALGSIVDAENKLLGLNHRQKGKQRRSRVLPDPIFEPVPFADPAKTFWTRENIPIP